MTAGAHRDSKNDIRAKSPPSSEDLFPGIRRSRDLLRNPGRDSLTRFDGGDGTPDTERRRLDANLSDVGGLRTNRREHSARHHVDKPNREEMGWPHGLPPTGPRSYRADVSPPAARRTSPHLTRPNSRPKGDSWRPGDHNERDYRPLPPKSTPRLDKNDLSMNSEHSDAKVDLGTPQSMQRNLRHVYKPYSPSHSEVSEVSLGQESRTYAYVASKQRTEPLQALQCGDDPTSVELIDEKEMAHGESITVSTSGPLESGNSSPMNATSNKKRNQPRPAALQIALANTSALQEDSRSLRSDGSTSSGRALSGRSSTISKTQTSRCYACKDSKGSSEQAERAELLENYVSCIICSRRYHMRCARNYEKDDPWTCPRCLMKRSRKSTNETLSERYPSNSPLQQHIFSNVNTKASKASQPSSPASNGIDTIHQYSQAQFTKSHNREDIREDVSDKHNRNQTDHERESLASNNLEMGQKGMELPVDPDGWNIRDQESRRSSCVVISMPSRQETEEVSTAGKHLGSHVDRNSSCDNGLTTQAETHAEPKTNRKSHFREAHDKKQEHLTNDVSRETSSSLSIDAVKAGSIHASFIKDTPSLPLDLNHPSGKIEAHISGVQETAADLITQGTGTSLKKTDKNAGEVVPSRESSYSPPPPSLGSEKSMAAKSMSHKCLTCKKPILSAAKLCSKCQPMPPNAEKITTSSNGTSVGAFPHLDTHSSNTAKPAGLNQVHGITNIANTTLPMSTGKRKQPLDLTGTEHIFVPQKKARPEYVPPKDKGSNAFDSSDGRKSRVIAKKSASNASRSNITATILPLGLSPARHASKGPSAPTKLDGKNCVRNIGTQTTAESTSSTRHESAEHRRSSFEETEDRGHRASQHKAYTEMGVEMDGLRQEIAHLRENGQQQAKEAAEKIRTLEKQRRSDEEEMARLRKRSSSAISASMKNTRLSTEVMPPRNVKFDLAPSEESMTRSPSPGAHKRALEAKGVHFESDSDTDDDSPVLPLRTLKELPQDPLRLKPRKTKDLSQVAPHYFSRSIMASGSIEHKKTEIALRPSRKQTFGKTLMYSSSGCRRNPHKDVSRSLEDRMMVITLLEEPSQGSLTDADDVEATIEFERSYAETVGMPKIPIPLVHDRQLAFRDGASLREGRSTRAKDVFIVGP